MSIKLDPDFKPKSVYNTNTKNQVVTNLTDYNAIDYVDKVQNRKENRSNFIAMQRMDGNKVSLVEDALRGTMGVMNANIDAAETTGRAIATTAVGQTIQSGRGAMFSGARTLAQTKKQPTGIESAILGAEGIPGLKEKVQKNLSERQVDYDNFMQYLNQDVMPEVTAKNREFMEKYGLVRKEKDGFMYDLISGGSSLGINFGLMALTGDPSASFAFYYNLNKDEAYQKLADDGISEFDYEERASSIHALMQGGLETAGGSLFKEAVMANKSIKTIINPMISEFATEFAQTGAEKAFMITQAGDESSTSQVLNEMFYTGLIGGITGGLGGAVSFISSKAEENGATKEEGLDMANSILSKLFTNKDLSKEITNTVLREHSNLTFPGENVETAGKEWVKAREKAYKESAEEKAEFKAKIEQYKQKDLSTDKKSQSASIDVLAEFAKTQAQQLNMPANKVLDSIVSNIESRKSVQLKDGTFGQDAKSELITDVVNQDFQDKQPVQFKMLHGTDGNFNKFKSTSGINKLGKGTYVTVNKDIATTYGENIKEVLINLQTPFVVKSNSSPFLEVKRRFNKIVDKNTIYDVLQEQGYDGIIQEKGDATSAVIFNPKQVNILKQGKRGQFNANTKTITLFEKANASTLVHELGHSFLKFLQDFNPQGLNTITQWAGYNKDISELSQAEYKDTQEKFARGFEAYLREGKAPTSALTKVFSDFKNWLTAIYKSIRALNVEITPEIRAFYSDMLSTKEGIQEDIINELKDIGLQNEINQWTQELKEEGYNEEEIGELILNQMDDVELKDVKTEEDKNVLRNRIQLGLDMAKSKPLTKVMDGKNIYEEAANNAETTTNYKDVLRDKGIEEGRTKSALAKIMEPISTTLKKISPKLAQNLRSSDMEARQRLNEFTEGVTPFVDKMFNITDQKDYAVLDLALKNGDMEVITPILEKYNMVAEHKQLQATLDSMGNQLIAAGVPIGKLENWFPRKVKNAKAYLAYLRSTSDWRSLEKYLNDKDMLNSPEEEQAQAINDFLVQKSLVTPRKAKGVGVDEVSRSTKSRTIATINDEMNMFYDDALSGLFSTISSMNNAITLNKFFGTSGATKDTIGELVNQLSEEGVIRAKDKDLVIDSLQAYFAGSSVPRWIRVWKNLTYLTGLTKFTSTLTQIKDLYVSSYRNGLFNTLGTTFTKKEIGAMDIGITDAMEEMADIQQAISRRDTTWDKVDKRIQKYLGKGLNLVGFSKMDMLGKNTFVQANLTKMRTEATKNPQQLSERLNSMFSQEEANQIMNDLKNKVNSSSVKKLLFYNISESMPISRAEMPTGYLNSSMGRLFYTFKTYSMKQMNIIYDDVIYKAAHGDRKAKVEAGVNLAKLSMLYAAFGVPVDMLKDMLMGRGEDDTVNDYIFENLLQMFGLSRWSLKKAKNEGIYKAVAETLFIPATPAILDIIKDVQKTVTKDDYTVNDWRAINSIPAVGNLYYWWFGGGSDK